MSIEVGAALLVVVVVVVVVTAGRRLVQRTRREKMEILWKLDGQEVVLGLSFGGQVHVISPRRGRLTVGHSGSSVVLSDEKDRLVFLEQIRWIEDPRTGTRFGDGW
jgi:hypothetical protein